jgi:hypothetical protein
LPYVLLHSHTDYLPNFRLHTYPHSYSETDPDQDIHSNALADMDSYRPVTNPDSLADEYDDRDLADFDAHHTVADTYFNFYAVPNGNEYPHAYPYFLTNQHIYTNFDLD